MSTSFGNPTVRQDGMQQRHTQQLHTQKRPAWNRKLTEKDAFKSSVPNVIQLAVALNGELMAEVAGSSVRFVRLNRKDPTFWKHTVPLSGVALTQDGRFAIVTARCTLFVLRITAQEKKDIFEVAWTIKVHTQQITSLDITASGSVAVTGDESGVVVVYDLVSHSCQTSLLPNRINYIRVASLQSLAFISTTTSIYSAPLVNVHEIPAVDGEQHNSESKYPLNQTDSEKKEKSSALYHLQSTPSSNCFVSSVKFSPDFCPGSRISTFDVTSCGTFIAVATYRNGVQVFRRNGGDVALTMSSQMEIEQRSLPLPEFYESLNYERLYNYLNETLVSISHLNFSIDASLLLVTTPKETRLYSGAKFLTSIHTEKAKSTRQSEQSRFKCLYLSRFIEGQSVFVMQTRKETTLVLYTNSKFFGNRHFYPRFKSSVFASSSTPVESAEHYASLKESSLMQARPKYDQDKYLKTASLLSQMSSMVQAALSQQASKHGTGGRFMHTGLREDLFLAQHRDQVTLAMPSAGKHKYIHDSTVLPLTSDVSCMHILSPCGQYIAIATKFCISIAAVDTSTLSLQKACAPARVVMPNPSSTLIAFTFDNVLPDTAFIVDDTGRCFHIAIERVPSLTNLKVTAKVAAPICTFDEIPNTISATGAVLLAICQTKAFIVKPGSIIISETKSSLLNDFETADSDNCKDAVCHDRLKSFDCDKSFFKENDLTEIAFPSTDGHWDMQLIAHPIMPETICLFQGTVTSCHRSSCSMQSLGIPFTRIDTESPQSCRISSLSESELYPCSRSKFKDERKSNESFMTYEFKRNIAACIPPVASPCGRFVGILQRDLTDTEAIPVLAIFHVNTYVKTLQHVQDLVVMPECFVRIKLTVLRHVDREFDLLALAWSPNGTYYIRCVVTIPPPTAPRVHRKPKNGTTDTQKSHTSGLSKAQSALNSEVKLNVALSDMLSEPSMSSSSSSRAAIATQKHEAILTPRSAIPDKLTESTNPPIVDEFHPNSQV